MSRFVGTVGWSYKDWKGAFYPPATRSTDWLAHYATRFPAVEVDSSFYAVPKPEVLDHWAAAVPAGFRFALKAPGSITHERLLKGCAEDLAAYLALLRRHLGPRLGPVILQLPPRFARRHLPDLFALLQALPPRPGLSVEFRHPSCFSREMFEVLRQRAVGLVTTDQHSGLLLSGPDVVLRLMGERDAMSVYDKVVLDRDDDLHTWAGRLEELPDWVRDTYVFVNNLYSGHAPATALDLGLRLGWLDPPEPEAQQTELFGG